MYTARRESSIAMRMPRANPRISVRRGLQARRTPVARWRHVNLSCHPNARQSETRAHAHDPRVFHLRRRPPHRSRRWSERRARRPGRRGPRHLAAAPRPRARDGALREAARRRDRARRARARSGRRNEARPLPSPRALRRHRPRFPRPHRPGGASRSRSWRWRSAARSSTSRRRYGAAEEPSEAEPAQAEG